MQAHPQSSPAARLNLSSRTRLRRFDTLSHSEPWSTPSRYAAVRP